MSTNFPLISVVIPAYNSRRFITETVESVLQQLYSNFELIIVDDGSTDGQEEYILPICKRDSRIRYVSKPNEGVSFARNVGYNHSSGLYVAFLDADDVWLKDNLMVKFLKFQTGDYGLVHSDALLIDEDSNLINGMMNGGEGSLLQDALQWTRTIVPGPSSILVRREVLNAVGLFDTNLSTSADHDFFLRVASKYAIGHVPNPTWKYRLHESNMHKKIELMEKDVLFLYKKASDNKLFPNMWFERECYANMYLILGASWAGDGKNKFKGILYAFLAIGNHPKAIFNIYSRVMKRWL